MTAFSNSTEFEIWSAQWCMRCKHDYLSYPPGVKDDLTCPILAKAICDNVVPDEWTSEGKHIDYVCTEFDQNTGEDEPDLVAFIDPDQRHLF